MAHGNVSARLLELIFVDEAAVVGVHGPEDDVEGLAEDVSRVADLVHQVLHHLFQLVLRDSPVTWPAGEEGTL